MILVFEGALEQAMKIGIEGASFITAYSRSDARTIATRLKPGSRLDESMARLVSRREGSTSYPGRRHFARRNELSDFSARNGIRPPIPAQGKPLTEARARASTKGEVLQAAASLASEIREGLGDKTPEKDEARGGRDIHRGFTRGDARLRQRSGLPRRRPLPGKLIVAVPGSGDPRSAFFFGRAYAAMGSAYGNRKRFELAEESYKKALKLIDRMTEREKYRTLGVVLPGRIAQLSPGDSELRGTRRQIPRR